MGLGERRIIALQLSGGEQQRVAIARAVIKDPLVVLADEPTGELDSHSEAQVLELLAELNRDEGHTIVIVTHDPNAAAVAQRVVFMRDGRIENDGLAGGLLDRLRSLVP